MADAGEQWDASGDIIEMSQSVYYIEDTNNTLESLGMIEQYQTRKLI